MPRKRQPTQLLPISISQSTNPTAETQRQQTRDRGAQGSRGDVQRWLLQALQHHHPTARHTGNPPGSCLEWALSPCGAAADFGTAFAVRPPPLWPPGGLAGTSISSRTRCIWRSFPTGGVQRKCATRITSRLSGCCRRRTLPAFAGCRGARSTERLRGAICAPRGSAIDFASIRPSWSDGSRKRRTGRVRRHCGEFGGASAARRVACAPCSMKALKARRGR